MKAGNALVVLVLDDLASVQPWLARGIKIYSSADVLESNGHATLVITHQRSWSWGIDDVAFKDGKPVSRKVSHE